MQAERVETQNEVPDEEWRKFVGIQGRYEVNRRGQIRREDGVPMTPFRNKWGHMMLRLTDRRGRRKEFTMLQIMIAAWLVVPEGCEVYYRDGNEYNAALSNLGVRRKKDRAQFGWTIQSLELVRWAETARGPREERRMRR
jgi:hypothetical protein